MSGMNQLASVISDKSTIFDIVNLTCQNLYSLHTYGCAAVFLNKFNDSGDPGRIRTCNLPLKRELFIALFLL